MPERIHPGDVVARRYRMVDLLHENEGGTFWRAYDQVLARSVAFHLIASDDPRADLLMDAARRSATVSDPRILRVLDADEVDGRCYVVNEWGNGRSLDMILTNDGPLPPRRAAWIVSEVADTLARGHSQGQAHGRLVPENLLIDHNGSVKIIGFALDAALHGLPPGRPSTDLTDLVAVLYAALTGRWAGVSRSSLPPAPQLAGHPLRPRKVKAGIPRALDRLCEEVLNPLGHTSGTHARTVESAVQVHDALVEFVGDPEALAAVEAGEVALARAALTDTGTSPLALSDRAAARAAAEEALTAPGSTNTDPDETVAGVPEFLDPDWHKPRVDKPPPPPRFEQPPEKPLYDPDPVRRPRHPSPDPAPPPETPRGGSGTPRGLGRGPRGGVALDERTGGSAAPGAPGGPGGERTARSREFWPWAGSSSGSGPRVPEEDPDVDATVPGRTWLRLAGVVGLVVVVLAGILLARSLSGGGDKPADPAPTSSTSSSRAPQVIAAKSVSDFDPEGNPPEENPDQTSLAVDGDPSTAWTTLRYDQQLGAGGLKDGVGLLVDLGARRSVAQISVDLVGSPTGVSLYLSDTAPSGVPKGRPVRSGQVGDTRLTASLTPPTRTRYVLVWLTSLPKVSGGYRGGVAEVTVRS